MALALALALCACATPAPTFPGALADRWDNGAGTWRHYDTSPSPTAEQLAQAYPDSARAQRARLSELMELGGTRQAYALLERITARGYRFTDAGQGQLNEYFAANGYPEPLDLMQQAVDVIEASTLSATVPDNVKLVESALRDRTSGRIYVTSIVSRGMFRQDGKGGWERVPLGEVGSMAGLLQQADGTIWSASGVYEPTPVPATAFRGLVGYDPASGKVTRIVAPDGATPSDIAIGPDGTFYAADPLSGAIYEAPPGAPALRQMVAPGVFRSPQGMAVSADGILLYVSDYGYGLAMIDLRTGSVDRLPAPDGPFLDGTDALWRDGDELVAIQNGSRPMRIVAHQLAPDGRSILASRILESANPDWTEPGAGSLSGHELLYVATGQWDRFGEGGVPDPVSPPGPTQIRALPLGRQAP